MVVVALVFSFLLAYVPISFLYCVNPSGDKEYLTGIEALRTLKEIRSEIEGTIDHNDIVEAVKYIASDRSRYMTGNQFVLDAGLLTR